MHEAVMAFDFLPEEAGLVCRVSHTGQTRRQRHGIRFIRVSGEDENQAILLTAGKGAYPVGQLALARYGTSMQRPERP